MPLILGIIGKPSSGKSTFLNAACLTHAEVSEIPFTTIEPNKGVAYVRSPCVCREMNVQDNPKNSICLNGIRFIPINLLDVAGLVPDAHKGKGLGNQFLNDLSRADLLIHIVDMTGSLDKSGNLIGMGENDPYEDILFLENEIDLWFKDIIKREDWNKFTRSFAKEKRGFIKALSERLSGVKINTNQIKIALDKSELENKDPNTWTDQDLKRYSRELRKISKPIITVANKIDKEISVENFKRLREIYEGEIIPTSALAEYILRKYDEENKIKYIPGTTDFKVLNPDNFNSKELETLEKINQELLKRFDGTGVQKVFEYAIFDVLNQICVYPVSDVNKLTDNRGNVLPDVFLVNKGTKLKDFISNKIHSELADNFLYGINARTKKRLGENYELENNDIIKIVATK
ncbi:MAG: redox-regulated ATPase YchF [Promethearchaeati archaeon]